VEVCGRPLRLPRRREVRVMTLRMPDEVDKFEVAALVRVRGITGPTMAVARIVGREAAEWTGWEYGVHCVWFIDDHLHTACLSPLLLEVAS